MKFSNHTGRFAQPNTQLRHFAQRGHEDCQWPLRQARTQRAPNTGWVLLPFEAQGKLSRGGPQSYLVSIAANGIAENKKFLLVVTQRKLRLFRAEPFGG